MNQLFDAPITYPDDFQSSWQAFRATKNDSKADGLKAWQQTAKRRLAVGATGPLMVACCTAYNHFILSENAKRAKGRQAEYPKLHFCTFLRQARYDGYMEDAAAILDRAAAQADKVKSSYPGWEDEAAKLADELSLDRFSAWFDGVTVNRGSPIEIIFPKRFKANYVATNFTYALRRAFGTCRLTATGTNDRFDI